MLYRIASVGKSHRIEDVHVAAADFQADPEFQQCLRKVHVGYEWPNTSGDVASPANAIETSAVIYKRSPAGESTDDCD